MATKTKCSHENKSLDKLEPTADAIARNSAGLVRKIHLSQKSQACPPFCATSTASTQELMQADGSGQSSPKLS